MKILFCGVGQIAKRHIALIQRYFPQYEIYALRFQNKIPVSIDGVKELHSWAEADEHAFAAGFITSPTHAHASQSLECARRGIPLFIEKPLSASWDGMDTLLQVVREKKLQTYVAYCFRFHPLVLEFKKRLEGKSILHSRVMFGSYMPGWRTKKNYKESYTVHREQGGGVILDCSHEIDMVEFLFGTISEISGTAGRSTELTVDAEDYADMLIYHPRGRTPLHLDFFSRLTQRYVEVDLEDALLRMDLKNQKITAFYGDTPKEESFSVEPDTMYVNQLRYFFERLEAKKPMSNDVFEAARLLKVILAFRDAAWPSRKS